MKKENLTDIIQVSSTVNGNALTIVTALCEDGSVWVKEIQDNQWKCINKGRQK